MTQPFDYERWKQGVLSTFNDDLTPAQQLDIANAVARAYFKAPSPLPTITPRALDELLAALVQAEALLAVMQPLTERLATAMRQPALAALLRRKSH